MAYLLSNGSGAVLRHPYDLRMLGGDYPRTSFPVSPSDAFLASFNVFRVAAVAPPAFDPLSQDLTEGLPVTSDGGATWSQTWVVTDVDEETARARRASAESATNRRAAEDLSKAEAYYIDAMVAGSGFTAEMAAYVAQLENPATLPGYPLVADADWPVLPVRQVDTSNPILPVDVFSRKQTTDAISDAVGDLSGDQVAVFEQALFAPDLAS